MTPPKARSNSNSRLRLVEFSDSAGSMRATRRVRVGPWPGSCQSSVNAIWIFDAPPDSQRCSLTVKAPAMRSFSKAVM